MPEFGTQTAPPAPNVGQPLAHLEAAPAPAPAPAAEAPAHDREPLHVHYHFHFSPAEHAAPDVPHAAPLPAAPYPAAPYPAAAVASPPGMWNVGNLAWPPGTPRRGRGRPTNAERQLRAQVEALIQQQYFAPGAAPPAPPAAPPAAQPAAQPAAPPAAPQAAPQALPGPGAAPVPALAMPGAQDRALSEECLICRGPADSFLSTCWHRVCHDCMIRWLVRRRACPDPRCGIPCTSANIIRRP